MVDQKEHYWVDLSEVMKAAQKARKLAGLKGYLWAECLADQMVCLWADHLVAMLVGLKAVHWADQTASQLDYYLVGR